MTAKSKKTTAISATSDAVQSSRVVASLGMACVLLRFLAQPPVNAWPLVFISAAMASLLVFDARPISRRGYMLLWMASSMFWLFTNHGIRYANVALYPAWLALGFYLGIFLPGFIGLCRIAIHELRMPPTIAGPLLWVGLELIRGYALTGYSGAMLGHSLAPWLTVFQIVDLCGSYTASFLVVAVGWSLASGVILAIRFRDRWSLIAGRYDNSKHRMSVVAGVLALFVAVGYGNWRLAADPHEQLIAPKPMVSVALLQADVPAIFEPSRERDVDAYYRYLLLSRQAGGKLDHQPLDLVVWPESMFGAGQVRFEFSRDGFVQPQEYGDLPRESFVREAQQRTNEFDARAERVQEEIVAVRGSGPMPHLLVGSSLLEFAKPGQNIYSCALIYGPNGVLREWYGKRHLVMFGEYIPFGDWLPWLYRIGPLSFGVTPGPKFISVDIAGAKVAPSICFETMIERGANEQIMELRTQGLQPDLLVNITNDGWFHGSSILDHHLRCAQAAAAAHHTPIVIAANGGITAWIDGSGRVQRALPRRTEGVLFAGPLRDERGSLYLTIGDWPTRLAALLCCWVAICGWHSRRPAITS